MLDSFLNRRGRMRRNRKLLRVGTLAGLLTILMISAQPLPASFTTATSHMHVVIDGVDFGVFDRVADLDAVASSEKAASQLPTKAKPQFHKIIFQRDFVTDNSLCLWATNTKETPGGVLDVRLVMKNAAGHEVSRYLLKYCQPMAWSVEAANPALGGFHESVAFVVQNIIAE